MTKRLVYVAGASASVCAASVAVAGGDKPAPQLLGNSINVQPVKIACAVCTESGVRRVGDWIEYRGGEGRRGPADDLVFDCFYPTGDCGSGGQWFLGTGYCNGFVTNDMTVAEGMHIDEGLGRIDFSWYWTCAGWGTEQCVIGVWTQESVPCEPDSRDYDGWLLNFGTLSCNPGGYYYSTVDISSVGAWPVPSTGTGSYIIAFLTSSGAALATCAQPMLWGTGDARGDPSAPGTQGPNHYDDDNPLDGSHTTSECSTYALGLCPDPLGAAAAFWGANGWCIGQPDCDHNGVIDTRDVTCFLNLWVPKDPAADCNRDGLVDIRDITCFLNFWVSCH